ncbi:MAG: PilZ domain-containing protein [Acidobacteriota bacterium]|jgi:hypothetical protein|nr:PilZ domain-containing protein [Acidobacteriota bacterium]
MGTVRSRVLQDRRRLARIGTHMKCQFRANGEEYEALMLDLSQEGAFLSSSFLPASKSKIFLNLQAECLKSPLELKGTVMRGVSAMSEHGRVGQFGVEFENPPLDLIRLISAFSAGHNKK